MFHSPLFCLLVSIFSGQPWLQCRWNKLIWDDVLPVVLTRHLLTRPLFCFLTYQTFPSHICILKCEQCIWSSDKGNALWENKESNKECLSPYIRSGINGQREKNYKETVVCTFEMLGLEDAQRDSRWMQTKDMKSDRKTDFYSLYYCVNKTSLEGDWSFANDLGFWSGDRCCCQME